MEQLRIGFKQQMNTNFSYPFFSPHIFPLFPFTGPINGEQYMHTHLTWYHTAEVWCQNRKKGHSNSSWCPLSSNGNISGEITQLPILNYDQKFQMSSGR